MPITRRRFMAGSGLSLATPAAVHATVASSGHRRVSQAELALIAHRHGLWHRRQPGGEIADFGGCDLSGLSFGRWELRHANFAGANLQGIRATETRFFRSHMTGCDLSGALLVDCDLRGVDLTRTRLVKAMVLETDFQNPYGGGLTEARLNHADLRLVRTNTAILGTDFSYADLRQADLRGAYGGAHFEAADLRNADLRGAQLAESSFAGAHLAATNARSANLFECALTEEQKSGLYMNATTILGPTTE